MSNYHIKFYVEGTFQITKGTANTLRQALDVAGAFTGLNPKGVAIIIDVSTGRTIGIWIGSQLIGS